MNRSISAYASPRRTVFVAARAAILCSAVAALLLGTACTERPPRRRARPAKAADSAGAKPKDAITPAPKPVSFDDHGFAPHAAETNDNANHLMGMNLNGPADWNSEVPFVDIFNLSRKWISQRQGEGWGKGPEIELDDHGWVKRLAPGCWVETPMLTFEGHKPTGQCTLLYKGKGELEFSHRHKVYAKSPGRMVFDVGPGEGAIFLRIKKTDPDDYVRDIRVLLPGHEATFEKDPFRPDFLSMWSGMNTYRFMDWMETNNSPVVKWSDRPRPDHATYAGRGIPVEVMVDLCNRQMVNPWFCMPHEADDEFVKQFAQMVLDRLDPTLHVYVEYSNELWNGMFKQQRYAGNEGQRLGYHEKHWEAGWRFTGHRSRQIFKIWQDVFGGTDRLVRVLASQGANTYVTERILEFEDAHKYADAVSIAPYMGMNVPGSSDDPNQPSADTVAAWSVEQILDHLESVSLNSALKDITTHAQVAQKYDLRLVAYEGGQHMVGVQGGENNEAMTKLFHAANRHARMGEIYRKYFTAWKQNGGDLFCNFSSIGGWSKWGSWGLAEYWDADIAQEPKLKATLEWTAQNPLSNDPPVIVGPTEVDARVGQPLALDVKVTDDAKSRMAVLTSWSSNNIDNVSFEKSRSTSTRVAFERPGQYELLLRASDGFARASHVVRVNVE